MYPDFFFFHIFIHLWLHPVLCGQSSTLNRYFQCFTPLLVITFFFPRLWMEIVFFVPSKSTENESTTMYNRLKLQTEGLQLFYFIFFLFGKLFFVFPISIILCFQIGMTHLTNREYIVINIHDAIQQIKHQNTGISLIKFTI